MEISTVNISFYRISTDCLSQKPYRSFTLFIPNLPENKNAAFG